MRDRKAPLTATNVRCPKGNTAHRSTLTRSHRRLQLAKVRPDISRPKRRTIAPRSRPRIATEDEEVIAVQRAKLVGKPFGPILYPCRENLSVIARMKLPLPPTDVSENRNKKKRTKKPPSDSHSQHKTLLTPDIIHLCDSFRNKTSKLFRMRKHKKGNTSYHHKFGFASWKGHSNWRTCQKKKQQILVYLEGHSN